MSAEQGRAVDPASRYAVRAGSYSTDQCVYEAAGFQRLAMNVVERLERASPHVGDAEEIGFSPRGGSGQGPPWSCDQDAPSADGLDYGVGLYKRFRRGAL